MKRFVDTSTWDHKWFRVLKPDYKCFWRYLCDNCDAAGVWEIDFDAAQFSINTNTKFTVNLLQTYFDDRVSFFTFENRNFLILTGFIEFQYKGELNPKFHPHKPVFQSIDKYSLVENNGKFYSKLTVNLLLQDKDKEKDKDKYSYREQDWYKNFETYRANLRGEFVRLTSDKKYISERENFHPNLDIKKTIEKACTDYWSKEAGWKNKKSSRSVNIDWEATFNNSLSQKINQVWKQKESEKLGL